VSSKRDYRQYDFFSRSILLKINLRPVFLFSFVAYRFRSHAATISLAWKK